MGLSLSRGKTLVRPDLFSLNSSFFYPCSRGRRIRDIPVIRPSMLMSKPDGSPPSGSTFSRFVRGWKGKSRTIVGGLFLSSHRRVISATGRSVEGLGIPADRSQICASGMADRERFLRCSRAELAIGMREDQLPAVVLRGGVTGTPPGWKQVEHRTVSNGVRRVYRDLYSVRAYEHSWANNFTPDTAAWWKKVREGGAESAWHSFRKRNLLVKMTGLSPTALLPPLRETVVFRPRRMVWVPYAPGWGRPDVETEIVDDMPESGHCFPPPLCLAQQVVHDWCVGKPFFSGV
jgi:hypothetical protein